MSSFVGQSMYEGFVFALYELWELVSCPIVICVVWNYRSLGDGRSGELDICTYSCLVRRGLFSTIMIFVADD